MDGRFAHRYTSARMFHLTFTIIKVCNTTLNMNNKFSFFLNYK